MRYLTSYLASLALACLCACGGADKSASSKSGGHSGGDSGEMQNGSNSNANGPGKPGSSSDGGDLDAASGGGPDTSFGALRVGFGKQVITPPIADTWTDSNGNAKKDDGEPYQDVNGNGRFDPYWLAGFHQKRPANGVHDDIHAIACVIDDGKTRLGVVSLDAIGFMFDQVEQVRARLSAALKIDHLVVLSTHNHEVPDLMGIWGPSLTETGINDEYMELVQSRALLAVSDAVKALEPAELRVFESQVDVSGLVVDTRQPLVGDPDLRALQFVRKDGAAIGQIVSWANHPEVLWGNNLLITADFVGYLRDGIDRGLQYDAEITREGNGGTTLFVNGAIGGLLTPKDTFAIRDAHLNVEFVEPSFDKARALGYRIAGLALDLFASKPIEKDASPRLQVFVEKVELPVTNNELRLAAQVLGILPRKVVGDAILGPKISSEMDLITLGGTWILTVPGELYPEIANGGVESPEGADFAGEKVETPPWRELMQGNVDFLFGLSNDAIGYIVPHSQWDERSPHPYGIEQQYGEGNSLGPDTAPILHATLKKLIARAK